MTTPEQPPYEPPTAPANYPTAQPAAQPGAGAAVEPPVRTVRKGPGWGAYLVTILALLLLIAVVVFVLQNTQRINIKFFSLKKSNVKTAVALGGAALVGFLAGLFLGLIPWLSARRQIRSLRRGQQI